MRRLAAQGKIEMAPQAGVETYRAEVAEILALLGHPEALVSDLSALSDFPAAEAAAAAKEIGRLLGDEVPTTSLIVVVAAELRGRRDLEEAPS